LAHDLITRGISVLLLSRLRVACEPGVRARIFPKARQLWSCRSRSERCKSGSKIVRRHAVSRAPQSRRWFVLSSTDFVRAFMLYGITYSGYFAKW